MAKSLYHCRECGISLIGSWEYAVRSGKCNGCQTKWYQSRGGVPCPRCGQHKSPDNEAMKTVGMCEGCYGHSYLVSSVKSNEEIEDLRRTLFNDIKSKEAKGCMLILPFLFSAFLILFFIITSF
jgi:hypothetical protein